MESHLSGTYFLYPGKDNVTGRTKYFLSSSGIGLCGKHIQELYTVYLTRFRTYKIALPPKQKPRRRGGLRQINTCRQVPLLLDYKKSRYLGFLCLYR
jgi:hypothetical protein